MYNLQLLVQILMLHLKIAPFTRCVTHINDQHVDTAESLDTIMNMYNFL